MRQRGQVHTSSLAHQLVGVEKGAIRPSSAVAYSSMDADCLRVADTTAATRDSRFLTR